MNTANLSSLPWAVRVVGIADNMDPAQDLCEVRSDCGFVVAEFVLKADAQVIAAAPDMLAEMRMFMPVLERLAASPMWSDFTIGTGVATINAFRAAIAKATGAAA